MGSDSLDLAVFIWTCICLVHMNILPGRWLSDSYDFFCGRQLLKSYAALKWIIVVLRTFTPSDSLSFLLARKSFECRLEPHFGQDEDSEWWCKERSSFLLSFLSTSDIFDDSAERSVSGDRSAILAVRGTYRLMTSVNLALRHTFSLGFRSTKRATGKIKADNFMSGRPDFM